MDEDFVISDKTLYDERSYREAEDIDEDIDEDAEYVYVPPWEMEW